MNEPMTIAVIESPYSAPTLNAFARNVRYARAAMRDAIELGYAPFASHLLYTQPGILDEADLNQRARGIALGHFPYALVANPFARNASTDDGTPLCLVYPELGITDGMKAGIQAAKVFRCPVLHRTIGDPLLLVLPSDDEAVRILTEPLSLPRNVTIKEPSR